LKISSSSKFQLHHWHRFPGAENFRIQVLRGLEIFHPLDKNLCFILPQRHLTLSSAEDWDADSAKCAGKRTLSQTSKSLKKSRREKSMHHPSIARSRFFLFFGVWNHKLNYA